MLDHWNKAIECYNKAIKLKPDYPEALNNLGITYQKIKSKAEISQPIVK